MIKIIMVPIDGVTERSVEVMNTALVVANRFGAHIKAVHVRKHTRVPFMFNGMPANYRNEFIEMSDNAMQEVIDTVKQQFYDFCSQAGIDKSNGPTASSSVTASLQILDGDAESVLAHEARLVDLIAMISEPGVAKVLSTTTRAPTAFAAFDRRSISTILTVGFVGVSR